MVQGLHVLYNRLLVDAHPPSTRAALRSYCGVLNTHPLAKIHCAASFSSPFACWAPPRQEEDGRRTSRELLRPSYQVQGLLATTGLDLKQVATLPAAVSVGLAPEVVDTVIDDLRAGSATFSVSGSASITSAEGAPGSGALAWPGTTSGS
ncbi:hypothetical protein PC123_g27035 [Phytophthora cactorum]|nr:hypothetical protein PC123_g27035 [Phytophthora cactorum]